ncbi:DUF2970 domain-containing protein [Candidatus Accumulibacter sp. ACC007]|uniref:DUF2970 domain-containing protein n=1 Tax=Candidatus Accumulibacter sp. ACC007 TaxID=2823333 RepID=UPI0025BE2D01|nr:DUF2970 domain-containing protein [Candidatus Accumulibacter sp. ACC007]
MSPSDTQTGKGRRLSTIRTVAWALLGIRGHKPHEHDVAPLSPLQILITALVFMLIFVLVLVSVAIYISRQ